MHSKARGIRGGVYAAGCVRRLAEETLDCPHENGGDLDWSGLAGAEAAPDSTSELEPVSPIYSNVAGEPWASDTVAKRGQISYFRVLRSDFLGTLNQTVLG